MLPINTQGPDYLINQLTGIMEEDDARRLVNNDARFRALDVISRIPRVIPDEVILCLAQALSVNDHVKSVRLFRIQTNDQGLNYLARAFTVNHQIKSVSLRGNIFGEVGLNNLVTSLKLNKTIEQLSLNGNNINQAGIEILVNGLPHFSSLKTFEFRDNPGWNIRLEQQVDNRLALNEKMRSKVRSAADCLLDIVLKTNFYAFEPYEMLGAFGQNPVPRERYENSLMVRIKGCFSRDIWRNN